MTALKLDGAAKAGFAQDQEFFAAFARDRHPHRKQLQTAIHALGGALAPPPAPAAPEAGVLMRQSRAARPAAASSSSASTA